MSNYKKYVMIGVSTILLPLAKKALKKLMSRYTEESEHDFAGEKSEEFTHLRRLYKERAQ